MATYEVLGSGVLGSSLLGYPPPAGKGGFLYPNLANGPGECDVILCNAGWADPRIFATSDLSMSRGVNEHGQLSFDLTMTDMVGFVSRPDRLRKKWVRWTHPTLGPWIGRIITAVPDANAGVVDCTAQGMFWVSKRRIAPKTNELITGPPGALIDRTIKLVAREEPLPINGVDADEVGDPVTFELRGQTVDSIMRALQNRSNQEWYVDPSDQRLKWRVVYGADKRHSVQLVDGIHLADYTPYFTLEGVTNALNAQPDDDRYKAAKSFWVERPESIEEYGRLEESTNYPGSVVRSSVQPIARRDLERRSRRGRTITLKVVNEDNVFARFGPGDTVTAVLSRINLTLPVRVMVQSYQASTGILTCTGVVP